nr:hypothetical protein [Nocardia farcinica]
MGTAVKKSPAWGAAAGGAPPGRGRRRGGLGDPGRRIEDHAAHRPCATQDLRDQRAVAAADVDHCAVPGEVVAHRNQVRDGQTHLPHGRVEPFRQLGPGGQEAEEVGAVERFEGRPPGAHGLLGQLPRVQQGGVGEQQHGRRLGIGSIRPQRQARLAQPEGARAGLDDDLQGGQRAQQPGERPGVGIGAGGQFPVVELVLAEVIGEPEPGGGADHLGADRPEHHVHQSLLRRHARFLYLAEPARRLGVSPARTRRLA